MANLLGDRTLNGYYSFRVKMVLERPFLSDTGEDSAHLFMSLGARALSHYNGFNGKMVLKRLFLDDTGKDLVHCSRYWGDRASIHFRRRQSFELFSQEMQLCIDMIVASWS